MLKEQEEKPAGVHFIHYLKIKVFLTSRPKVIKIS